MLLRNIKLLSIIVIVLLCCSDPVLSKVEAWYVVYGDVLQVFPEQNKLLLETKAAKEIFVLDSECTILRQGQETTLYALRPVDFGFYQDALCWIDSRGLIRYILVNYHVQEEEGHLLNYDIFGNLK